MKPITWIHDKITYFKQQKTQWKKFDHKRFFDMTFGAKIRIAVVFLSAILCVAAVLADHMARTRRADADEAFTRLQEAASELRPVVLPTENPKENEPESAALSESSGAEPESEPAKIKPTDEEIFASYGIVVPEKNLDWDALRETNPDIYAWIYVPDTNVDYPVLQHPTDDSYYLDYNLDGTKGFPGCIYTEHYNKKDFSDPHTVIYGHNLKERTMFTTLHNLEKIDITNENHYIYIYTPDKVFVYLIFGAYDFASIHLLANFDLTDENVYAQYLQNIFEYKKTAKRVANIRENISVTKEDRIVTLSTCTMDRNADYRYLVAGVLLNP